MNREQFWAKNEKFGGLSLVFRVVYRYKQLTLFAGLFIFYKFILTLADTMVTRGIWRTVLVVKTFCKSTARTSE